MAFNLFPQTDFRQIDLNYVLAEVKRASNLTDRVDGLSAEIRDPETGLWKSISDIHAANSSQQAQINALIAAQVFARPEDFGGVGDGVADDTAALQAALNSDKPVYLKGTYGISDTIHVNKDKIVLCGESAVIKTLGRVTYALRFGDDPTTGPDAAIPGLIQVLWYGGTLTCDTTNYFDYGFSIERCFNSCFYGVSVTNCVGTGFRWGGDYGANAIADNCIVRGPDAGWYGVTGFLVGRNDQRIFNCSAVNMTTGFYTDRGYVRFEGCYCWLTRVRDAELQNVVAYDIVSPNCAVIDCTVDTVPTGIKLHPTSHNFYAQGLAWYSATSVIADPTGFALFRGSEAGLVCNGFVSGIASSPWPNPVNICTNVSGLTIIGFMIPDATNIQDPDIVTQVSDIEVLEEKTEVLEEKTKSLKSFEYGHNGLKTSVFMSYNLWAQGVARIDDILVGFNASNDDHSNTANYTSMYYESGYRYKARGNHNLGHCASADYSEEMDVMLVANGTYVTGVVPTIYLVSNAKSITNAGEDILVSNPNVMAIEVTGVEGDGIVACFGESSDIVYAMKSDDPARPFTSTGRYIYKLFMGKGANDMTALYPTQSLGTFISGKSDNEYNGTAYIMKKYTGNYAIELQGMKYFNGRIAVSADCKIDNISTSYLLFIKTFDYDNSFVIDDAKWIPSLKDNGEYVATEAEDFALANGFGYVTILRSSLQTNQSRTLKFPLTN